jgi:hypothetical protein
MAGLIDRERLLCQRRCTGLLDATRSGPRVTRHVEITLATRMDIYFCDPHSPWQRGTNENTVIVGGAASGADRTGWCRQ